ncbi:MAG: hypothetical protein KAS32_05315 [Candidatus Peribacteraceae bacterium]|nr:hypothetical protein [Candidatus Peribacteraceae bacterium]
MAKKLIDRQQDIDLYSLEGNIVDVLEFIKELQKKYGDKAVIDFTMGFDCYTEAEVKYKTLESDKEEATRLKRQKSARESAKKRKNTIDSKEKEQLLKLARKHGYALTQR